MERKLLLKPSKNDWESGAVLNPTAIRERGVTHLIYRAVKHPNYSSLGYARIVKGNIKRFDRPFLKPEKVWEREGVEDPRITKVGGTYYLLYTAWDGKNARVALAVSKDLKRFRRMGVVSPNIPASEAAKLAGLARYRRAWKGYRKGSILFDKDAVLFPEKISGKFVMLHRLEPDIQIVYFRSFSELKKRKFWENYLKNIRKHVVMRPKHPWESEKIGAGATPIKTEKGWLLLYHGVQKTGRGRVYRAGAALLDLKHPEKEIARLEKPLFGPTHEWERKGDVNNVVFPEGAVVEKGVLSIFYGCADSRIGLARVRIRELLKRLEK